MDDLFGHTPRQSELFAPEPGTASAVVRDHRPQTPDTIREKMLGLLAQARAADTVPWTPRMLHSHTVMFPYMAEWLPGGEGDQLLLEFRAELKRLGAKATAAA